MLRLLFKDHIMSWLLSVTGIDWLQKLEFAVFLTVSSQFFRLCSVSAICTWVCKRND